MQQVENFEAACAITGDNPNIQFPEGVSKATIAGHKLEIIHKATVGDAKGKYGDGKAKYIPWLEYVASRGGFVYSYTVSPYSVTHLGARFWFPDRDTAREFTNKHIDLVNVLHGQE